VEGTAADLLVNRKMKMCNTCSVRDPFIDMGILHSTFLAHPQPVTGLLGYMYSAFVNESSRSSIVQTAGHSLRVALG
jgi:hypothetical protein